MDSISFNTGRMYTAFGQPIVAVKLCDTLYFVDHARHISGWVKVGDTDPLTKRLVLLNYDANAYEDAPEYIGSDMLEVDDFAGILEASSDIALTKLQS